MSFASDKSKYEFDFVKSVMDNKIVMDAIRSQGFGYCWISDIVSQPFFDEVSGKNLKRQIGKSCYFKIVPKGSEEDKS